MYLFLDELKVLILFYFFLASDRYPHFVNIQDPLPEFHPLAQQEVMYIVCVAIITIVLAGKR